MSNRAIAIGLIVVGIIVVLASIFAHQLGLGSAGFGVKKIAGVVVGIIIIAAGLYAYTRAPSGAFS
jgi:hypothetical protein